MEPIVNRVAESDIEVYNLETLWDGRPLASFDLEPFLHRGLVLREVEFRERLKAFDWSAYAEKHVAVFCSTDAIIPTWAYMLVATKLDGLAASVAHGTEESLVLQHFMRAIEREDWERYRDRIVVVKGCGSRLVPPEAYVAATLELKRVAKKLMFGEPCSSVPIWRRPAEKVPAAAARPAGPAVGVRPAMAPARPPGDAD